MYKYQNNLPVIHWDRIQKYWNFPEELSDYLEEMVRLSEFIKTEETAWAYYSVESFLEDGWMSAREYAVLKDSCPMKIDVFGQLINKQVSGTRYESEDADTHGVLCTTAGPWPSRADKAAFLYFVATEP